MIYPNPISLFCAILLCFPLALILTFTSNSILISPNSLTNCKLTFVTFLSPPSPPPSPPPPPPPLKPITKPSKRKTPSKNILTSIVTSTNNNVTNLTQPLIKQPPPSPPLSPPPPTPPLPIPKDDKDDVDLLKRASRVNPNPNSTHGHQKKVAFLFLTTTPLPFAPLWELFFNQSSPNTKGLYNIYIHADPSTSNNSHFNGIFSGRVIPSSKPTRRNTPTLITAARRLLAHALLDDPDNYMFTLLSSACIPLHSFNFTWTTLVTSTKSFIEVLSNETTAYGRWSARGEDVMLPEVPFKDFRIGSQFWTLTRSHARVVVSDIKLWRKFRLPCVTVGTCYPEENYFPTLLSMVDPQNVVPATLTNVNWVGRYDGHPHTYNASEVDPGLIRWLRDTRPRYGDLRINGSDLSVMDRWDPFLFARKFEPNCVKPLINIAKDVLFKD